MPGAKWFPHQTSFLGGEIHPRHLNSYELEIYRTAVFRMRNWMPTREGSAIRTPGSMFIRDMGEPNVRKFPILDVAGQRALVCLLDSKLQVITSLGEDIPNSDNASGFRQQIMANPEFNGGKASWEFTPAFYYGGEGDGLGCRYRGAGRAATLQCSCRNWKYPAQDSTTFEVKDYGTVSYPTDTITLDYRFLYITNPGIDADNPSEGTYTFDVKVGTSAGASDLKQFSLTGPVGTILEITDTFDAPTVDWTGEVHITINGEATSFASTPVFSLDRFAVFTDAEVADAIVDLTHPYSPDEFDDIHFIQSPYDNKELYLFHPNHPPHRVFWDPNGAPAQYVSEPVTFTGTPGEWTAGKYPATCAAYQGRLWMFGPDEQFWGTKPGEWDNVTVGATNPDDAIDATSIYRSPIRWAHGHKRLIVGAEEMEYVISADQGLVTSTDIFVDKNTDHGSKNVQPAGVGQMVAFAAERGTRLRGAQANRDNEGWVAPDLSLYAAHITQVGIKRIVRMRNPHEMVLCLLNNGTLGVLHFNPYTNQGGWSTLDVGGEIIDIVAQPNNNNLDVLYLTVKRFTGGTTNTYLEAIVEWGDEFVWEYLNSYRKYALTSPQEVISGLDHLEGEYVQVVADRAWLGTLQVQSGSITLPRPAQIVVVGLSLGNRLGLLPPPASPNLGGPSSEKRNVETIVRVLGGTRPIINGQPPPDRDPATPMNLSQALDLLRDNEVTNLEWDALAVTTIEEPAPFPCQIIGVFNKLAEFES